MKSLRLARPLMDHSMCNYSSDCSTMMLLIRQPLPFRRMAGGQATTKDDSDERPSLSGRDGREGGRPVRWQPTGRELAQPPVGKSAKRVKNYSVAADSVERVAAADTASMIVGGRLTVCPPMSHYSSTTFLCSNHAAAAAASE